MSVARRKIGDVVQCVNCGGGVMVPQPLQDDFTQPVESDEDMAATAQEEVPSSTSQLNHEMLSESSLPYDEDVRPLPSGSLGDLSSTVPVTRFALYSIGGLILGVAVVSFLLGWAMGQGSVRNQLGAVATAKKHRIYGRVSFTTESGRSAPDTETVVIALPRRKKPDEKLIVNSLRPDVPPPNRQDPTVRGIREIGGDVVRTDASGEYELEVNEPGEYYLLILSSHVTRAANRPPMTDEIVALGQYFKQTLDLLGKNDFVWRKHLVRTDKQYDHSFSNE